MGSGRWALLDYSDVVVHIFLARVRDYYDIEGLWAEAERTVVEDKPGRPRSDVRKKVAK